MKMQSDNEKTQILNFNAFKGNKSKNLLDERKVETAPQEFREFRPYKDKIEDDIQETAAMIPEVDDIIGTLINEFSDELELSNRHDEEANMHFFKTTIIKNVAQEDSLENMLEHLNTQITEIKDNCSRVKFLVDEIEMNINVD
jgi:hypothetical protein